jgi:hypothetical protein
MGRIPGRRDAAEKIVLLRYGRALPQEGNPPVIGVVVDVRVPLTDDDLKVVPDK